MKSGKIDLNGAVGCLGKVLVSDDDTTRSKGYQVLYIVLNDLPIDGVGSGLQQLCKFLSNRLHDFMCITDLLPCIDVTFTRFRGCLNDDIAYFLTQLFSEVSVRALSQTARFLIFKLLDFVVEGWPNRILFHSNG